MSVLVPVRNEEACVRETAAAMQAQRFDGEIELLFMDGRSEDRTRAMLDELAAEDPRIRVLDNPRRRIPHGLNIGLREARGQFIVRMDAHTHYLPDYIAIGVARLEAGDVEWVTGPQIPDGSGRWSRRVSLALNTWLGTGGSRKWDAIDEVELDTGVFTGVWRRSTLEAHGGWDEGWPVNQDSELAARVLAAGGRILCLPALGAHYIPRDSLPALARQYWRYGYYRAKTARRHPHSMRRSHVLAPGLVLSATAAAVAPFPASWIARATLGGYLISVLAVSARAAAQGRPSDILALPAVFATMHLSWGAGFLAGCVRFGPPLRALAGLARHGHSARAQAGHRTSPGPSRPTADEPST